MIKLKINTDGASRGNPGPASYGYVVKDENSGVILHQEGKVIGVNTNNVAEYTAVLSALTYVKNFLAHKGIEGVYVFADSLLVVSQLSGVYKIKNQNLKTIFEKIKALEIDLEGKVYYKHIPREQNFIADKLANIALDNEIK